ncbi:MAG TPA: hypothetical protein VJJ79_01210 [Candidatus Nanoarchaeia archaeon]|nr:hypothetical protein [Candidatus Nanoarchaeia archaeon]
MAKRRAKKETSPMVCMPGGKKDWAHTILAAMVIVFAVLRESGMPWAYWVVLIAAVVIFLSGVLSCCRKVL